MSVKFEVRARGQMKVESRPKVKTAVNEPQASGLYFTPVIIVCFSHMMRMIFFVKNIRNVPLIVHIH